MRGGRPGPGRATSRVVTALAAFALTAAALRPLVPWTSGYDLRRKVEYFARHKDELDAVILGSSRTYRGIAPRLVEEPFRELGLPFHAFNLGSPGMDGFETDFLLREALALEPARLRWVFLELCDWDPRLDPRIANTWRTAFWHSTPELVNTLSALAAVELPLAERLEHGFSHVRLWALRVANLGRGADMVTRFARRSGKERDDTDAPDYLTFGRGYRPLEDELDDPSVRARRAAHLATLPPALLTANDRELLDEWQRAREARSAGSDGDGPRTGRRRDGTDEPDPDRAVPHYDIASLRRQARFVREAGYEPFFFVLPGTLFVEGAEAELEAAGVAPVFVFNDPRLHTQFLRADRFFDTSHFTRRGAIRFSRVFGERAARWALRVAERAGE